MTVGRGHVAKLERDPRFPPQPNKQSLEYRFGFPPQEFKLEKGDAVDPTTGEKYKIGQIGDDFVVLRPA